MDSFADEFDDVELARQDKGKRPVHNPYSDSEDEDEYEEEDQGYACPAWADQQRQRPPAAGDAGAAAPSDNRPSSSGGHTEGRAQQQQQQQQQQQEQGGGPAAEDAERGGLEAEDSEPGDLTCAICLGTIPLENLALVKGCDHMYCTTCILHWALHKEEPWCPQCKQPFSYLLTYRTLDGELQDFPTEESVTLLKRARWFEDHLRFTDRAAASLVEESRLADAMAWQDYTDSLPTEDEEIENFYFSSAAGRARVVLGNRRYGEGGFISGGRRHARPVVERKRSNKMGKSGEHAVVGTPSLPPGGASFRTPNAGGGRTAQPGRPPSGSHPGSASTPLPASLPPSGPRRSELLGSSPGTSTALYGSSPSGSGRRARRNARRAAMDAALDSAAAATVGFPSSLGRCSS